MALFFLELLSLAAISVRLQQVLPSPVFWLHFFCDSFVWFFLLQLFFVRFFCEILSFPIFWLHLLWDSFVRFLLLQSLPAIFVRFSCQVLSSPIFWLHLWFHSFVRLALLQSSADMRERKERQQPPCHGVCPHCSVISSREKSETAKKKLTK